MEYEQFIEDVKHCIRFKVDSGYEIKVNRITKNNSVTLDGLVLFKEGDHVSPNIYLNDYYEQFQEGRTLEAIADDIIDMYHYSMTLQDPSQFEFDFTFEEMKHCIILRLVNYKKNRILLEDTPHIRFLDLAIIFCCLMQQDEYGIGTIRITNEHMEQWNITVKELMALASKNTPIAFPLRISTMEEVIRDMLRKDVYQLMEEDLDYQDLSEESVSCMVEQMLSDVPTKGGKEQMYIMTNASGINGASTLLYKDAIKEFAVSCNCDFFVLPSSVHEVILVPMHENVDKNTLIEMVQDVNQTQVPEEEVLSNRIYCYYREGNRIEIV